MCILCRCKTEVLDVQCDGLTLLSFNSRPHHCFLRFACFSNFLLSSSPPF